MFLGVFGLVIHLWRSLNQCSVIIHESFLTTFMLSCPPENSAQMEKEDEQGWSSSVNLLTSFDFHSQESL